MKRIKPIHVRLIRSSGWFGSIVSLFVAAASAQVTAMGSMASPETLAGRIVTHDDSGTSIQPISTPAKMPMSEHGG
jgi:outer membrane receptor for ferric coprogen and ferric-rhodotorulic acid